MVKKKMSGGVAKPKKGQVVKVKITQDPDPRHQELQRVLDKNINPLSVRRTGGIQHLGLTERDVERIVEEVLRKHGVIKKKK